MLTKNTRKSRLFATATSVLVLALGILPTFAAYASMQKFNLKMPENKPAKNKATVSLDVPSQWKDVSNLFGMPLMLLGPITAGARPVISVQPTDAMVKFDPASMKDREADYRKGREEYIKGKKGSIVAFYPYAVEKWAGVSDAQVVGYKYKIDGVEFTEKSYYVTCKDYLYHLKTLVRSAQEADLGSTLNKTVKSFTCE